MEEKFGLGADIGGSHITTAIVDLNRHRILEHTRFRESVNSKGTADAITEDWLKAIRKSLSLAPVAVTRIGIAMPGPFDYEKGISLIKDNDKYESLDGINIKKVLSDHLSVPLNQICFSNDAGCFLKGELFANPNDHCRRAIGITLGTGLGTARFKNAYAEDANLWCKPFLDSIAEEYISTRWFLNRFYQLTGKKTTGVKSLASLYDADASVPVIFNEFAENLGRFLSEFIREDDPEVIVLGGNIARASRFFLTDLEARLQKENLKVPIKIASLGEDAPVLGAVI